MKLFVITMIALLVFFGMMALGVIFKRSALKGSCGGASCKCK